MDSQARDPRKLARLIKEIRTRKGLNQKAFGKLFEPPVTPQAVGQWERGEHDPDRKYWPKIAKLCGMDLGQFYEYVESGSNSQLSYLEEIVQKIKSLVPKDLQVITRVAAEQWANLGQISCTANMQHLALLKQGPVVWNKWRNMNPDIRPELNGVDMNREDCTNLSGVNLAWADLRGVSGYGIDLSASDLANADLSGADLRQVKLEHADLRAANLSEANLSGSSLMGARFDNANLGRANLKEALLIGAILTKANLSEADLTLTDLRWASLSEANLDRATLVKCKIYGVSTWGIRLEGANQSELDLSCLIPFSEDEASMPVDDLAWAQLSDLRRNNPEFNSILRQRLDEEEKAIEYAKLLLEDYEKDVHESNSRIYSNPNGKSGYNGKTSYQVYQKGNILEVKELDESRLILRAIDGKIQSNLRPGDLDNLKALVELEAEKKEVNDYPQMFIDAATTASRLFPEFGRGIVLVFHLIERPDKIAHIYLTKENISNNKVPETVNFTAEAREHLLSQLAIYNPHEKFIMVHLLPNGYQEIITIPFSDTGVSPPNWSNWSKNSAVSTS